MLSLCPPHMWLWTRVEDSFLPYDYVCIRVARFAGITRPFTPTSCCSKLGTSRFLVVVKCLVHAHAIVECGWVCRFSDLNAIVGLSTMLSSRSLENEGSWVMLSSSLAIVARIGWLIIHDLWSYLICEAFLNDKSIARSRSRLPPKALYL
jgi:hypothetical protein